MKIWNLELKIYIYIIYRKKKFVKKNDLTDIDIERKVKPIDDKKCLIPAFVDTVVVVVVDPL